MEVKVKILLDRILDFFIKDTKVYYDETSDNNYCDVVVISPIGEDCIGDWIYFDYSQIDSICQSYTLDEDETIYIWDKYKFIVLDMAAKEIRKHRGENINENIYYDMFGEKVSNYMGKVLKYLVDDTEISESFNGEIMISVPFSDFQFNRIRYFNVGFFIDYCMNTYGLNRKESEYLWGDYLNEMDYILKYEFGVNDPVHH
jgi:hypothetical protein